MEALDLTKRERRAVRSGADAILRRRERENREEPASAEDSCWDRVRAATPDFRRAVKLAVAALALADGHTLNEETDTMTMHSNTLTADHTKHFRRMVEWLRDDKQGAGLSWNQLVFQADLERILKKTGRSNAPQVLQDISRSRLVNEDVYNKVESLYRKKRSEARNGDLGQDAKKAVDADAKPKRTRKEIPLEQYQNRILKYLAEHPGAMVGDMYINVTGSSRSLRPAMFALHKQGRIAHDGVWPPQRGQVTTLHLPGAKPAPRQEKYRPGAAPKDKQEKPAPRKEKPEQPAVPAVTLADVRKHIDIAMVQLEALSKARIPNVPTLAQEFVRDQYLEAFNGLADIRKALSE